jgi:tetratricopeptide (TPR) repeat protein
MASAPAPALNREDSRGIYADEQLAEALAYYRGQRFDKAEAIYRKILKKEPNNAGALHMLGLLTLRKDRAERAVQLLIKAAKIAPDRPEILCDLGNAFKGMGRHKDAIKAHRMVLTLLPESPEAHSNLGSAFNAAGKAGKAVECFEKAVKLRPNDPELLYNLGNGMLAAERFREAEEILRRVIYERPDHIRAHINLGAALKEQGKYDAAIERLQKAIAAHPASAEAHWNYGLTLLSLNKFEEGWSEYEWRTALPGFAMQHPGTPQWQGEPLEGRVLLVHAEQGLGDTIQFARYLPLLQKLDGRVLFACTPRLHKLLRAVPGMVELAPIDRLPKHDVQSPLISLPRLFENGLPYVPKNPAYLPAERARVEVWREALGETAKFRIGIAWQGSPDYGNDVRRSIPLVNFDRLVRTEGVEIVSLQQGEGLGQIAELGWENRIRDYSAHMDRDGAFVDTLAVMASLDLVVTSDTAIAHVAGAAGRPVQVALCHQPDWRWGLRNDRSAWYPSMTLVRQKTPGDWAEVFDRIVSALPRGR